METQQERILDIDQYVQTHSDGGLTYRVLVYRMDNGTYDHWIGCGTVSDGVGLPLVEFVTFDTDQGNHEIALRKTWRKLYRTIQEKKEQINWVQENYPKEGPDDE